MKKFYVSRDPAGEGVENAVMITMKKPEQEVICACGKGSGLFIAPETGVNYGADGELCYSGWLKLTGMKLAKGEVRLVQIVEVE